jgi:transcriptional regulator with XRE-family HTH domain
MAGELKALVSLTGLRQFDLAARIGVAETRLSRALNGRAILTMDELKRLERLVEETANTKLAKLLFKELSNYRSGAAR